MNFTIYLFWVITCLNETTSDDSRHALSVVCVVEIMAALSGFGCLKNRVKKKEKPNGVEFLNHLANVEVTLKGLSP